MTDYIVKSGNLYFQRWDDVEGQPAPVLTNLKASAHHTDREAAEMIVTMLGYGNIGSEIESAEQSDCPGSSPGQSLVGH